MNGSKTSGVTCFLFSSPIRYFAPVFLKSGQSSLNVKPNNNTLESVGGKIKTKRRSTNKRHTNKRKTKKTKKTRKYRRKQRGGDSMDTEYLNVNERDKKDYDQMINSLNWDPKQ